MRTVPRFILICALAVAACSQTPAQKPYVEVATATIAAGDPLPAPTGQVVVSVDGDVSKANGPTIELDLATIEQMGLVRYEVHDPWLNEDLEFTGVLLSTFLDAVGASSDATDLTFTAVDDYQVHISVADARRWPIMLATQTNGEPMPLEGKGPTRIVFPYDQFPEIDQLAYKDLWIWQIATISVS